MKLINLYETRSWVPGGHEGSLSREVATAAQGATKVAVHTSTVAPGGGSDLERHPSSEQIFVVLSGMLTFFDADGNEYVAGPNTALFVPVDALHASANRGDTPAVCLVITAPPVS